MEKCRTDVTGKYDFVFGAYTHSFQGKMKGRRSGMAGHGMGFPDLFRRGLLELANLVSLGDMARLDDSRNRVDFGLPQGGA